MEKIVSHETRQTLGEDLREDVRPPSLDIITTQMDKAWSNLLWAKGQTREL